MDIFFGGDMSQLSGKEKRKNPRVYHSLPVRLSVGGIDIITETNNISCSGAYAQVNQFVEPMTKLKIVMMVPVYQGEQIKQKKVMCEGVVVRCVNAPQTPGFFIAIFFHDISLESRQILSQFVQRNIKKPFSK